MPTTRPTLSLPTLLIAAWALTMISIPILRWTLGDGVLHWGVIATVLLLATAVLATLRRDWGLWITMRITLILLPAAWALEWIGSTTGFPFGSYHYTNNLQPQLLHVPVLIPFAWLMMLPPAWAVGYAVTGQVRGLRFVLVSALAFTAWDLFLDPQMVGWGFWVWDQPGGYFGIPWVNFLGWVLGGALLTLLARPPALPVLPLLIVYTITWLLQSIGQLIFWGMVGPALTGFVVMGLFVGLAWRRIWSTLDPDALLVRLFNAPLSTGSHDS